MNIRSLRALWPASAALWLAACSTVPTPAQLGPACQGRPCPGRGARRADPCASVPGRQRPPGTAAGAVDALADGAATTGLQPICRAGQTWLHREHSRGRRAELCTAGAAFSARHRAVAATRRFQCAMKASAVAGVVAAACLAKGARMPSTADDDCAEMRKAALRAAADLRWGLDCLRVMAPMVRLP